MPLFISRLTFLFILYFGINEFSIAQNIDNTKSKKENGIFSGTVIQKKNGIPISNATIYISDLKLGTSTKLNGYYSFHNLPIGNYLVQVYFTGFKTIVKNIAITDSTIENFELVEDIIEQNAVVVTGVSKATQIKRNPIPIVTINHDYLITNINSNIIDAISKIPGVSALTTGPNVSKPFIRGLGYNRILTLYDGVRQEGQQWGDEHGIEVDQYGIDRIEVIKGPASLTYGSDALAGVVNLIPTQPAPEGKLIGDRSIEYATNNGLLANSLMLGFTKNGLEGMTRFSHKQASNYQNKIDGRVYNTAFKETDISASIGLHRKWGYSHLSFSLFDDIQEIPDGSRDSATRQFTKQITETDNFRPIVNSQELKSYDIGSLYQHVQHYRIYSTNNFTIGNGRLNANLGFQRSVRREFSHPEFENIPGLFLQLNTYLYDLKYHFHEWNGWDLTIGANGMYQNNIVTKGTEFIIPSYQQFDIGPFALLKKTWNKLDISGGIRYDNRSFTNTELFIKPNLITGLDMPVYGVDTIGAAHPFYNYKHRFSGFSGSIGGTYNFSDQLSIKANISRGFRAPNIAEISANGVHPGTNIYQIGNSEFKPEFSLQEDIGVNYSSKYTAITFSIFNNTISNYIFNQKLLSVNGGDSAVIAGNQTYKFQQGKANLYGGELSIDIHPIKALHFENSLSVVYGKNKNIDSKSQSDSNKYLPFIPPLHGVSELRYDFNCKSHHIVNGFAKLELVYYTTQNRVYLADNTETITPGYTLFNASIGSSFTDKKGKIIFNLYIIGNNLWNVAYQDHLSRLKYFEQYPTDPRSYHGIYNMGRNIALKFDFPF